MTISVGVFFLLRWTSSLWLPLISWAVNYVLTVCLAWFIGKWITKRFILKSSLLPPIDPKGKAVLITGCDSGFGHMTALELNSLGFHVIATVYSEESPGSKDLVQKSIYKNRMTVTKMDVTNKEDVLRVVQEVSTLLQNNSNLKLFALINNAGIASGGEIEWSTPGSVEDYEKLLSVNTLGVIRVTRSFLPFLRKSRGRVINLSSILGKCSLPGLSAYCVSKAATAKFTEGLQTELHQFGVKGIDVQPWFFKTPMLNPRLIVDEMKRRWSDATDEVRSAYGGEPYLTQRCQGAVYLVTNPKNVIQTPEDVVDTLVDAVISPEPDTVYRVITPGFGIGFWIINDALPWDLLFYGRRLIDRIGEIYATNDKGGMAK